MKKQMAVLGLGHFGTEVALSLAAEGVEVLAVDRDDALVEEIKDRVTRTAIADVSDDEVLKELGVESLDGAVVAVGGSLEASILCCMHLRELGCKNITAKMINADHEKILRRLGVQRVVNPEREAAQRLAKHLAYSSVVGYIPLAQGISLLEVAPTEEITGRSLIDAQIRQKYNVQVVAIHDVLTDQWHVIPDPNSKIKDSDVIVVIGKDEDLQRIARKT